MICQDRLGTIIRKPLKLNASAGRECGTARRSLTSHDSSLIPPKRLRLRLRLRAAWTWQRACARSCGVRRAKCTAQRAQARAAADRFPVRKWLFYTEATGVDSPCVRRNAAAVPSRRPWFRPWRAPVRETYCIGSLHVEFVRGAV